jgi:hypothetical protein
MGSSDSAADTTKAGNALARVGPRAASWILFCVGTLFYFAHAQTVPTGYLSDSASAVLNAVCLRDFGRDEWGFSHPWFIASFGDFKAPLYTYLLSLLFRVVPPDLIVARYFSMALGYAAVVGALLFLTRSSALPKPKAKWFFGVAALVLLSSSWFLVLHRFPTEVTVVGVVVLAQLVTTFHFLRTERPYWAALSGLAVGIGVHTYHSQKLIFPAHCLILIAIWAWAGIRWSRWNWRLLGGIGLCCAVGTIVAFPVVFDFLTGGPGTTRVASLHATFSFSDLLRNAVAQLDGVFLFLRGDANLRHHHQLLGHLNLVIAPFLAYGVWHACRRALGKDGMFWAYVVLLAVAGALPAILASEGVPHAVRSSVSSLPLVFLAYLGFIEAEQRWTEIRPRFRGYLRLAGGVTVAAAILLSAASFDWYFRAYPGLGWCWDVWVPAAPREVGAVPDVPARNHDPHTVGFRLVRVLRDGERRYCADRPPTMRK